MDGRQSPLQQIHCLNFVAWETETHWGLGQWTRKTQASARVVNAQCCILLQTGLELYQVVTESQSCLVSW